MKGCLPVIAVGIAAIFVGSMFYTCGQSNALTGGMGSEGEDAATVLGTASGVPLSPGALEAAEAQTMAQFQMGGELGPDLQTIMTAQALSKVVDQANIAALARQAGVKFTDEEIRGLMTRELDRLARGTPEEIKQFEQMTGQPLAQMRTQRLQELDKLLAAPGQRSALEAQFAGPLLVATYKARIKPTEADVRKSYDTWTVKRIVLRASGAAGEQPEARAQKVLREIRGGLAFEAAMNRYSDETPPEKKRVSEQTSTVSMRDVLTNPDMRPLMNLKPGGVSEPVKTPEGPVIYKLISVKSDLPKDFEKRKAHYTEEYVDAVAQAQIGEALRKLRETPGNVTWQNQGVGALYAYNQTMSDRTISRDPKALNDRLRTLVAQASEALTKAEPYGQKYAALALYGATNALYNAPGADKAKLRPDRIKALEAILETTESPALRLDLAGLYEAEKNGQKAFDNLLQAASANMDTTNSGQTAFEGIGKRLSALQAAKLVTPEQVAQVEKEMRRWREDKLAADKMEAETRAQEEAARKQAEAEAKKAPQGAPVTPGSGPKGAKPRVRDVTPGQPKGQ